MAAKIKLKRMGKNNMPIYRIVVIDHKRSPSTGDCLDNIGTYNPMVKPKLIKIDNAKLQKWLSVGAKPTETVAKLIEKAKVA